MSAVKDGKRVAASAVEMKVLGSNGEETKNGPTMSSSSVGAKDYGSLFVVYLAVAIDMLGVSIILPVLPSLAVEFDVGSQELGMIFAAYGGAQMLSMPLFGKLSDRVGRRPIVILSLVGSCVGFFLQGLSGNYGLFMISRVVAGLFGSTVAVTQAYIADTTTVEERPRYLAALSTVIAVAFLFGPGIGSGLAEFSLHTPMFVASGLAGAGVVMAFIYLKESERMREIILRKGVTNNAGETSSSDAKEVEEGRASPMKESKDDDDDANVAEEKGSTKNVPPHKIGAALLSTKEMEEIASHRPLIYLMWLCSFLNMCAFSAYLAMYGYWILEEFGYGSLELGFISMGAGIITIVTQLTIYNPMRLKLGKHTTLIIALCIYSIGFVSLPLFDTRVTAIGFVGVLSVGYGLASPSIVAILSRYASSTNQGSVLGIGMSCSAFARVVGPIAMGFMYDANRDLPFYTASILAALNAGLVFFVLTLNRKLPEHATGKKAGKHSIVMIPRVRLGTLGGDSDDNGAVSLFDFVALLLRKRGYLRRELNDRNEEDVTEMTRLLRDAVLQTSAFGVGSAVGELAESLEAHTRAPPAY